MTETVNAGYRVSPQQRHLWATGEKLRAAGGKKGEQGAYTQSTVAISGGPLDVTRLRTALAAVVAAHEPLRTAFTGLAGRTAPVQVVLEPGEPPLTVVELPPEESGLDEIRLGERTALDPRDGSVFRAALARAGDGREVLVLTAHALVADRASLRIVAEEILAACTEEDRPEGEPPVQYADFAAWHHDLLTAEDAAPDRAYWSTHAVAEDPGTLPGIALPGAAPGVWRVRESELPAELVAGVDGVAAKLGTDAATVLHAALRIVVRRLAGDRDLPVALTRDGRSFPELRRAVGAFEREFPLVHDIGHDTSFAEYVRALAALVAESEDRLDHCDPELLGSLDGSARGPFVTFTAQRAEPPLERAGLTFTTVHQDAATGVPVRMTARRDGNSLRIELGYDEGRVDEAFPDNVSSCLLRVLRGAVEAPERPVGDIPLLTDEAAARTREAGRGPHTEVPRRAVHELFAEQAARTPRAVAVSADGQDDLTYAELDDRANQLAHHLAGLGVGPGQHVVVSAGRSAELLVALLGVLKAGAAFVPVDVGFPARRLEFALRETAAPVLLCTTDVRDRLGSAIGTAVPVALDTDQALIAAQPATPTGVTTDPGDPAYILYTSGTTGRPNGVRVPHRALVNYLTWCGESYGLDRGSGALVHTSIGFDLTLTALLGPLLAGGRVVMLPESAGITGLIAALRTEKDLTLVKLTPTHLDVINQLLTPEEVHGAVRTLVVGGEALRAESLELFRSSGARIVNEYGPTETTVGSVAHVVDAETPHTGPVPIGCPLANTTVHVLDSRRQAVPDGVPGELWIGGAGVADGYLGRPELTRERFAADGAVPGEGRLHRTGDLARRRPDGTLEYLGRTDAQVKIRGVRVEPAETESVLAAHPGVAQAVVVARLDDDPGRSSPLKGELTLVGYVVPARDVPAPTHAELVAHCREQLPEPCVPAALVTLDALPVTGHGKVDRAALPAPHERVRETAEYIAPRTATEEILAASVAKVLGVERVGVDDNYFVLGGDSIRSVMIASRAQARGVDVTVADLHRHPTVRRCAAHLDAHEDLPGTPVTGPFALISAEDRAMMPPDVEDAFPLNLLQEGMIFHRDFAAKSAVYHAIASVRLRAPFDLAVMRMVVHQLVERHPMLRTSFDMSRFSRPLQLVHREFADPLHHEDLRGLTAAGQDARVDRWIEREKERGFELHEYPLIRFMVQRLADDAFQFTYGFHHEIVDGWSEALMITELFSHYFSVIYDEPITVKPPTAGMRDAVALELEALKDRRNYEFWDSYLADATLMRLPRPGAGPRADKGERDITRIAVPVSAALSDGLKRVAAAHAVPLKTVLMAAHMTVMSLYGGHEDTLTYTVTNGRPETADGSTAIGLFVNSLALRLRMRGGTWAELFTATLESERASMPYRRLPMAELKRHQGNEPLAETLFFFTNYHVFNVLDRWTDRGVGHVANELYGESTFPFCGIFRLNRETGALEVRVEYDSLQFSDSLMESIRDSYARVLAAIAADPDGRYDRPEFRSDTDLEALAAFTRGPAATASDRCLHDLVAERAAERPDAPAVQLDTEVLSYGELNRRANRLAHHLRTLGAGAETVVGVHAERSVVQIVALLAVLKAGAAYLPLDPAQPEERTAAVLAASGAVAVVHQPGLAPQLPAGVRTVAADAADGSTATHNPEGVATPGNAAYVMYTSGSTGQPKGVVVEHRNVVASLAARRAHYPAAPERFLLLSSFAFDSSVAGIFWTLTEGGTLVLPGEGQQLDPAALVETAARQRPTHTLAIPSLLAPVLDQAGRGDLDALSTVIAAGESCPAELARTCRELLPGSGFHNEYGPTEATVWSAAWDGENTYEGPHLPIGRPVAGTWVHPRDHRNRTTPLGVAGELVVGGAGVARGYLGRPADTAAAFRPDPESPVPGGRAYATGDLGRYLADGQLEFLGRADHQVKIRGFRVELGEIEAVLDTHADLQRAIVVARGDNPSDQVLVAYVLPAPGKRPEPADIQAYIRDRLPRYMVPTGVIVLDAVPLTAAGKVDRASLPAPSHAQLTQEQEYIEPGTDTERTLAAIWADVLKLDRIGAADSFFDIGGESLRAMQATAAANKVFRTRVSVRRLFDAPSLREFAHEIDQARLAGKGHGDGITGTAAPAAGGAAE
ncbi:amino acid adenylation domain-containing protein [Streptomyces sp. NPDC052396]|uniref:amino acid adenylation domain-containing protein n=1 Tax=Streptomyces sp. NPDC052396 TaxID=3365689 RepID=UPI0037D23B4C